MDGDVFLLKGGDGAGTEVFTTIDALRGTQYAIDGEIIDITSKDSPNKKRELLDGGGKKKMTIQADGVWNGTTEQKTLRTKAGDGSLRNYQLDDGDTVIEGAFQITNFSVNGPEKTETTYSLTLESSGDWTIT